MQDRTCHFSNTLSLKRRQTGCSDTDRGGLSGHGLVPSFAIKVNFSLRGPTDLLLQEKASVCRDVARAGAQLAVTASRRFPKAEPRLEASPDPLRAAACEPQAKEQKCTGSIRTYWLDACLRNSSSVCLKVSRRHLFTVFSTLTTSPAREGKQQLKPC